MNEMSVPVWGWVLVGIGFALFVAMVIISICRNHGVKRSLFASPYIIWIVLFTVLPVLLIGYYAFKGADGSFSFDNFRSFWDSNHALRETLRELNGDEVAATVEYGNAYIKTLGSSLFLAFWCTLICLVLGYPAALFMADRNMKLGSSIVVLFIIPMWMNFLLRTYALMTILEGNGLINTILAAVGLPKAQLIGNQGAVLLGMVYNYLPFMIFPIYTVLSKMDVRLTEAAADLGCNSFETLYKVTIPLSLPGVISGITMVFMPSVTTFFIPRVLGGGNMRMFGDVIESTFLTANNWNLGSAMSIVMMILILISLAILRKADPNGEGGGM